jgi:hypothetical protein
MDFPDLLSERGGSLDHLPSFRLVAKTANGER